MSIFEYEDYKDWVNSYIKQMQKGGRGEYRRLAEKLNTNSAIISQIFKGAREITPEQAISLTEYFALSHAEQKYFILLVNYARAASFQYKKMLKEEIEAQKVNFTQIKNRVEQSTELSEQAKMILYSNWYYLATWSLIAIPEMSSVEVIAERLQISKKKIRSAVDFLLENSLIVQDKDKYKNGPSLIHLEAESPLISRHHQNWRLQAFRKHDESNIKNTFYTAPVTLSESDARKIREKILQLVSSSVKVIKNSPSEKMYCLGIDWFEI